MSTRVYGSLARIADFRNSNYEVRELPSSEWATGDYVEGEVIGTPTSLYRIEDRVGHMVRVEPGDWVVGALGDRAATLEGVGSWRDIGRNGVMHALTSAGIMGLYTSMSQLLRSSWRSGDKSATAGRPAFFVSHSSHPASLAPSSRIRRRASASSIRSVPISRPGRITGSC